MSKKERIEDLGKVSILLRNIYDHDLFDQIEKYWRRPKDSFDLFYALEEDQQAQCIHMIAYGLDDIKDKISECLSISDGDEE